MAEIDFERGLEKMFSQAPELPDAGDFAQRVGRRLDRGWATRRWMIGVAGVAGGLIGASQLVSANVIGRLETASQGSERMVSGLNHLSHQLEWFAAAPSGGIVWPAAALAVVAMGFVLSRVIEEI